MRTLHACLVLALLATPALAQSIAFEDVTYSNEANVGYAIEVRDGTGANPAPAPPLANPQSGFGTKKTSTTDDKQTAKFEDKEISFNGGDDAAKVDGILATWDNTIDHQVHIKVDSHGVVAEAKSADWEADADTYATVKCKKTSKIINGDNNEDYLVSAFMVFDCSLYGATIGTGGDAKQEYQLKFGYNDLKMTCVNGTWKVSGQWYDSDMNVHVENSTAFPASGILAFKGHIETENNTNFDYVAQTRWNSTYWDDDGKQVSKTRAIEEDDENYVAASVFNKAGISLYQVIIAP